MSARPFRPFSRLVVGSMTIAIVVASAVAFLALRSDDKQRGRGHVFALADADESGVRAVAGLSRRQEPAVTPIGSDRLFVYGGAQLEGDAFVLEDDGAVVSLSQGTSTPLPRAPIGPLLFPAAASDGLDVVVLGPQCGKVLTVEGVVGCSDGHYMAARFDTVKQTWEELELPSELRSRYGRIAPGEPRNTRLVSEAHSSKAVFVVGDTARPDLLAYDFESDSWDLLPPVTHAFDYCASGDGVFALTTGSQSVQVGRQDGFVLPVIHRYDVTARAWTPGGAQPTVKWKYQPRLACMADTIGVVGGLSMTDNAFAAYVPKARAWSEATTPPVPFGRGSIVWTGSALLALPAPDQVGLEVATYDPMTASFGTANQFPWSTPSAAWNGEAVVGYTGATNALFWGQHGVHAVPSGVYQFTP